MVACGNLLSVASEEKIVSTRAVAQFGSALDWGSRGRGFKSRQPDYLMDFPPDLPPEQVRRWQRFFDLREDILLDYGYQTARAYWGDLQDIFEWAVERDKDILTLTGRDLRQYRALLRRRKYSEATIRRRMVAWRKMEERMKEE